MSLPERPSSRPRRPSPVAALLSALVCACALPAPVAGSPSAQPGPGDGGDAGEEGRLRGEILASLEASFGRPLESDAAVDAAARDLARDILGEQVLSEVGRGFTAARTHLWERGVVDPELTFAAVVFDGALAAVSVLGAVADLPDLGRFTHVGVGIARRGDEGCAAVLLTRREVDLEAWPAWSAGAAVDLVFSLREGLSDPVVDVIGPGPRCTRAVLRVDDGGRWHAELAAGRRSGVYRTEIRARRGDGDDLVAIGVATIPGPTAAPRDPEAYVRALVDLERERYGLKPLEPLEPLDGVATGHSARLRGGTPFGHRSPARPDERIEAAGIPNSVALENVGRARSLDWVHTLFMASPGHRANVLDPRVTHLGVGLARSDRLAWYVTLNFVRLLPPVDLERVRQRAREAIAGTRARAQLSPLMTKRVLDQLAQRWCEDVAAEGERSLSSDQVRDLTDDVVFAIDDAVRVVADLAIVEEIGEISWLPELSHHAFDQYGLGIYQDPAGGMLYVMVILVDRHSY